MEESKSMKILEVCSVPPKASPSPFSLSLTFLDKIWLPVYPTSRLLFYELPQQNTDSLSTFVTNLKNSLSLALQHYLPLAGQLTWPQDSDTPVIQYQAGDGVSLTVAETRANFQYLSGNEFRDSAVLRSLLPDFPTSETKAPAITLQITLFPYTGFCISYVAHHSVMDGKSISMFLHSWAYICKHGHSANLPPELTPYFDRSFIRQQVEFERAYPKSFGNIDPESRVLTTYDMTPLPNTMLGTFILTRKNIDTLKKLVLAYWEKKNKLETTSRVSTFVVVTAYVIVCLIKAKKIAAEKTFIGINVNARARLDPPLLPNYFGNCVVWCGELGNTKELLSQNGFFVVVELIIEALASLNEGLVKAGEKLKDFLSSALKEFVVFGIAGSPQFELYKADFGWGRPKKVEMVSIDKGSSFYLSDDRDANGGIEIGVALKNHETEAFASFFTSEIHAC